MTQPAARAKVHEGNSSRFYSVTFWALLLAFEAFVFSLPLFPTGDGGLHIYYASIFRDLVTHRSPLYAQFYSVRHLIQPYLLHYYVFIGLCSFLSADAAEKVIVAITLATVAIGFRSLVRALSPVSPAVVLLVFPLLLSWPLAMGALNYTFAIGLMLFALGAYERFSLPGPVAPRLWRFAGLLLLLVLSHPVPLLLLIGVLAVDLLLRWWQTRATREFWTARRPQLLALALSCLAFIVPILIADKGAVGKSVNQIYPHWSYLREVSSRLGMFYSPGLAGRIYTKLFFLLLPLSLCLVLLSGLVRRIRQRSLTSFDRLAIFSFLFVIATLFAPGDMNGSSFFAFRLWLPCWLLGLASCSGAIQGSRWNRVVAGCVLALSLSTLVLAQWKLRPIARDAAELETAPLPEGKLGLFVPSSNGDISSSLGVSFPVLSWNAGRVFASHQDVMLNSPWLQLTIIPVHENGAAGLLRDYAALHATEHPFMLSSYLVQHPAERTRILDTADFILFVDPGNPHPDPGSLARFTLGDLQKNWRCSQRNDYALCQKAQPANL